jgi:hypothetical protein
MKKLIGIAAAIPVLALGVSAFTLPAASAAQSAPAAAITTTTGTIRLTRLGLYLNDRGNSSTNGAVVQVWNANGGAASVWQIMSDGTIRHNGLCLDAVGAGKTNGTKLDLWTCTGGANQQWNTGGWRITNPVSGKVLNDSGYGGNGTQQVLWTNVGSSNEVWGVTPFMTCQVVTELVTTPGTTTQVAEQGALLTGPPDYQTVLTMIEFNNGTAIRIDWPSVQLDVGGNQTMLLGVGYPPLTSCAVIPDPDSL